MHAVSRSHARRPSWAVAALAAVLAVGAATGRAEDEGGPLAPITVPATGSRVDPMRPVRLSREERERLYDQVARDAEPLEQQARQLRRLVTLLLPSVVHLEVRKALVRPRKGRTTEDEAGAGVIVEIAGRTVVITNRHVVDRAQLDGIVIRLHDRREVRPKRLWSDAGTDLAVLEVDAPDLAPARLAAADTVATGDLVLAIGSPFSLPNSITQGIVSATGRRDLQLGEGAVKFQDFIQTDTPINPGNSGGPLVNLRGEVVGINTCIASNSGGFDGLSFAIPVSIVAYVARQLVETGTVSRGFLGVALDREFTQADAHAIGLERAVGARVDKVTPDTPAALAGIRPDDVVLEFDGRPVEDDDHLVSLVGLTPMDSTVELVLFRDGTRLPLRITLSSRDRFEN